MDDWMQMTGRGLPAARDRIYQRGNGFETLTVKKIASVVLRVAEREGVYPLTLREPPQAPHMPRSNRSRALKAHERRYRAASAGQICPQLLRRPIHINHAIRPIYRAKIRNALIVKELRVLWGPASIAKSG